MSRLYLLTPLAITLLVSFPTRAQEAATFHCTFKAVFETIESDSPTRLGIEKQFVGRRMYVLITDKPTAKVIGDVFTITKQASDYVVSQVAAGETTGFCLERTRDQQAGPLPRPLQ
jgi:hypothetical protein